MFAKKIKIATTIVIAFLPALAVYGLLPGISLAFSLLWICFILLVALKTVQFDYDEMYFLVGVVLISFVSALMHLALGSEWFDYVLFLHNLCAIVICLIPLSFVKSLVDVRIFVKSVLFLATVASFVLIWQWLMLFFTGSFQNNVFLPGLAISRDLTTLSNVRPSSFFTEPAHFSIYMLPAFQITLLLDKKFLAYLFAFAILCSGSSTGFLMLCVLLVYHLISYGSKRWYVVLLSALAIVLSISILLFILPDFFAKNLYKLELIRDSDSNSRLLGPLVYLQMFQKYEHLLGITLNQLGNFLTMKHFVLYGYKNYANAFIYMYISYGLVGFILLIWYLTKKLKSVKGSYGFFLICVGIVASDQILFNAHFFYLVTFVLLTERIYKLRKI